MKSRFRYDLLPALVVAFVSLALATRVTAQQNIFAEKLFATDAGERQGLAYDPDTDHLYTLERATTRVAPLLRAYTLEGFLLSGPDTLDNTAGARTKLGLHFIRESATVGGQAVPSGSLLLLRDAVLYVLDKSDGSVIALEALNADFDTGGLCVSPLAGGGKGLGYSTNLNRFFSTNSCCNCTGVAEFVDGQVTGYIPISVPGTSGGGDVKEHPLSGQLWVGNAPGINSLSVLSQTGALIAEYTLLDAQTGSSFGVMRLAFDSTGDRLWVLGADGSVYQVRIQDVTSVPESIRPLQGLEMHGVKPNPSASRIAVSFTLASNAPVRLELLSISGRRVLTREVSSLGIGDHVVDLDGLVLASGVYIVRLTQGGATVSRKAIIAH